jgi:hypothetical protein
VQLSTAHSLIVQVSHFVTIAAPDLFLTVVRMNRLRKVTGNGVMVDSRLQGGTILEILSRRGRRPIVLALVLLCVATVSVVTLRAWRTPAPRLLRLADGTEVFYLSNTSVRPSATYPVVREIKIDGEAFVRAPAGERPLEIRTRLLLLTVSGASALRVTARSEETGEEADVLYGHVVARKGYPSRQNEPDTLLSGEEVMVNETIDLQEKETAEVPSLRAWSDALMASVARKNRR